MMKIMVKKERGNQMLMDVLMINNYDDGKGGGRSRSASEVAAGGKENDR